jgi:hypothetical protein
MVSSAEKNVINGGMDASKQARKQGKASRTLLG